MKSRLRTPNKFTYILLMLIAAMVVSETESVYASQDKCREYSEKYLGALKSFDHTKQVCEVNHDCQAVRFNRKIFDHTKFVAFTRGDEVGKDLSSIARMVNMYCGDRPVRTEVRNQGYGRTLMLSPEEARRVQQDPPVRVRCVNKLCTLCGDEFEC